MVNLDVFDSMIDDHLCFLHTITHTSTHTHTHSTPNKHSTNVFRYHKHTDIYKHTQKPKGSAYFKYTQTHRYTHTRIHTHKHTDTHTQIHTHTNTQIHTHKHTHTHTQIHTHKHTDTHTLTHTRYCKRKILCILLVHIYLFPWRPLQYIRNIYICILWIWIGKPAPNKFSFLFLNKFSHNYLDVGSGTGSSFFWPNSQMFSTFANVKHIT